MGLKVVFVCLLFVGFLDGFDSVCLDLFGCVGFCGFPYGFDVLKLVHCMFKRVPGTN